MRAAFCEQPGEMVVREVDAPEIRQGDALVRVAACGICGSDLHWYGGGVPVPRVCPGHEIVGEVIAVRGGSRAREGDRVAVEPLRPCGSCARCRRDQYHLCAELQILGIQEDGGLADIVRVPCSGLFPLPRQLDFASGVLVEPLAVSVHAARLAEIGEGDRVLVLGSGSIGLLSIAAARHRGAREIVATARYAHQAAAATMLGATTVFGTDREGRHGLRDLALGGDIDVVIETVGGTARTLEQAVQVVAPGGRIVVLGVFEKAPLFPALMLLFKEIRVIGSMVYNRVEGISDFDVAIDILENAAGSLQGLVTHRFALDDCDRAFGTAADKRTGAVKVVIEP